MKKIVAIAFLLCLLVSVGACGKKGELKPPPKPDETTQINIQMN